jgi:arylsulfatase A-like enzyme
MTRRTPLWITAGVLALVLPFTPLLRPRWRERTLRAAPRPLDVVLLTLDTTRADHLGCYGRGGGTSPNLDGLARAGVMFRRAYSHVPLTSPSHASLLTGLLPSRHGVHDNGGYVLKEEFATLAESFVEAGYRTGAFVSAFVLDRRFGLARGFATYEDDVLQGRPEEILAAVRAEVTVDRALAWLRAPDPRPAFAWVHLYDPHLPYDPPEPYATQFKDRPYDGEIAYMDAQVGRLLGAVAARGRPTVVAAIGDHGESLGEHQEMTHSYFIYQATQRVPFILALPGWLPRGLVVEPVVRGVDLMPTLLDIAGLRVPPGLDGESLVPLVTQRRDREPGPVYLESYHPRLWWGARELLGLRTGRWLFIQSPRPELYDVDEDPAENVNLAARYPQEIERFAARLKGYTAGRDPMAGLTATDPETAGRLRALGYAGGTAAASGDAQSALELPDAKDNAPLLAAYSEGEELSAAGQLEAALGKYREALASNPRSVTVRLNVANTLLGLGRFHESCEEFAALSVQLPNEPSYVQGMARCLAGEGKKKEALGLLTAAVAKASDATLLREELGAALLDSGRAEDAEKELRLVVDASPRRIGPRLRLATTLVKLGRLGEASTAFVKVLDLSPRSPEGQKAASALEPLADRLLEQGDLLEARKAYRAALEQGGASGEAIYFNLALVDYRLGRRGESVEVLQKGLAELPGSASLHYRLGRLHAEAGRRADAEREYRRAIELDGARKDARQALASLLESPGGRP